MSYYQQLNNQQQQQPNQQPPGQNNAAGQNPFGGGRGRGGGDPFGGGQQQQQASNPFGGGGQVQQQQPTQGYAQPQMQGQVQQQQQQQQQRQPMQGGQPNQGGQPQQQQQQPMQQQFQQVDVGNDPMIDYTLFNSDPALMKTTTQKIPGNYQQFKESQIPYGISVKPYGDLPNGEPVPSVSFKNDPIVRCKDCRAYICPFVRWLENGAKWICPFCGEINPTGSYYYSTIEADGYRTDHDERAEFNCGTYDLIANHEYMNRPPMPPTFIFAFDVSKPAVDSGYLELACSTIKSVIEQELLAGMAENKRTKIAFLSYDKNLHFYNLRSILKQPQMMVVTDTENVFLPQLEDLLVDLEDSYDLVMNLLDNLPRYFLGTKLQESCFISALQCANNIIKQIGGKMVFFQVSSMILRHSKLQPPAGQEEKKTGTERNDLWKSTNNFFKNTGVELGHAQISFDLFDFAVGIKKGYKNIKTFGDISARSNGNLFYYPEYTSRTNGLKFSNELYHNLTRKIAWEAVFRIRLSQGWNQLESFGNIQIKAKTNDLVLAPCMDSDRVFSYEFEKAQGDGTAQEQSRSNRISKRFVFIQTALLYSSSEGQRRIRCHNIAVPLTNSTAEAFEYLDITSAAHFLLRKALARYEKLATIESMKMMIEAALNNMARANQRASNTPKGQAFEFDENMQYFIMYVLGLLKSEIIHFPTVMQPLDTVDKIVYLKFMANNFSPDEIQPLLSPQIINICNPELNQEEYPALEVLQKLSLRPDQIYVIYNSVAIYFYVGQMTDPYYIQTLFKVDTFQQIDKLLSEDEMFADMEGNAYLTNLYGIIQQIRYLRVPFVEIRILLQGDYDSEQVVQSTCILDEACNARYRVDYAKFLQKVQGQAVTAMGATVSSAGAAGVQAQPGKSGYY